MVDDKQEDEKKSRTRRRKPCTIVCGRKYVQIGVDRLAFSLCITDGKEEEGKRRKMVQSNIK
jgi:hypothetical protein